MTVVGVVAAWALAPGGGGKLTAGEVGPGRGNEWHQRAIGLTRRQFVCLLGW
jgi:hypothetical protein